VYARHWCSPLSAIPSKENGTRSSERPHTVDSRRPSLEVADTKEAITADYATLLRDHVTLTCRSVDRIFLQAYVPKLQSVGAVCQFLYWQKGFGIPSSAAFRKIGDALRRGGTSAGEGEEIAVRRFAKGEKKEEIARPLVEAAEREGGDGRVVLIGITQEKTPVWRSWKAKGQELPWHGDNGSADWSNSPTTNSPLHEPQSDLPVNSALT
jgi:hypothetical protein